MVIDLTEMLRTTDSSGNLMPSYLGTQYSDVAIYEGLCAPVTDTTTVLRWIRLTAKGRRAAENAKRGGRASVPSVEIPTDER